jgi:hypothetical protein
MHRWWLAVDVTAKLLLGVLLLHAALNPTLPQYADKAMQARVLAYPLAVLVIPAGWFLLGRRRAFPVIADLLFTLPFLIDAAGNALDLYDSIEWWDDLNHLCNWILLSAAFVWLLPRGGIGRAVRIGLGVGFAAVSAILWELMEYVTFVPGSAEASTAYEDTLGDLGLGLLGGAIGATLATWITTRGDRDEP